MFDAIEAISGNLEMREPDVWFARSQSDISYPTEANAWCFDVEQHSFWFRHRNEYIGAALKRFPPSGAIFDIGGGNGFVTQAMRTMGFYAILVEPGVDGVRNALRRGIRPVICATLEDADFYPKMIPAVGLFDVVEHIEDDVAFLTTIHRLLRPGGRLYLTTPAYNLLWSDEDEYAGHYRRYTRRRLARALTEAGFQVEYVTHVFALLPAPIFFLRALPCRLGLRRGISIEREHHEHRQAGGLAGAVIERIHQAELRAIERAMSIPFGGSCMAVARA